jgi:hypothetical protein
MPAEFWTTVHKQADSIVECGGEFVKDTAYAGLISPINSVRQMCGQSPLAVLRPDENCHGAKALAKEAGAMAGNILDFMILRKGIGLAVGEQVCAAQTMCSVTNLPKYRASAIGLSTLTGMVQGYCLTEVHQGNTSAFSIDRLRQGVINAASMPASDGTTSFLHAVPFVPNAGKSVCSDLVVSALSGAAGGVGQKECTTRFTAGRWATFDEVKGAFMGGAFGGAAFHTAGLAATKLSGFAFSPRAPLSPALESPVAARTVLEAQGEMRQFTSRLDFDQRAGSSHEVEVNIYRAKGLENRQVVIPRAFDLSLNELRQLRLQAGNAGGGKATEVAWSTLRDHPRKYQLLPEDVPPLLAALPNPSYFKKVILQSERNPSDAFYSQQAGRQVYSAAKTVPGEDSLTVFPGRNGVDYGELFKHEWSHQLEVNAGALRDQYDLAAKLEANGHFDRDYARLNTSENWAVHMESVLGDDADKFKDFVARAPIRASILGKALKTSLDSCSVTERSPMHSQYVARANYIQKQEGQAAGALLDILRNGTDGERAEAATLLAGLERLPERSIVALAREKSECQTPAVQVLLAHGDHSKQVALKLLKDGTINHPSAVAQVIYSAGGENSPSLFRQALTRVGDSPVQRQALALETFRQIPSLRPSAIDALRLDLPEGFSPEHLPVGPALEDDSAARAFYNNFLQHSPCGQILSPWRSEWETVFSDLFDGTLSDDFSGAFH